MSCNKLEIKNSKFIFLSVASLFLYFFFVPYSFASPEECVNNIIVAIEKEEIYKISQNSSQLISIREGFLGDKIKKFTNHFRTCVHDPKISSQSHLDSDGKPCNLVDKHRCEELYSSFRNTLIKKIVSDFKTASKHYSISFPSNRKNSDGESKKFMKSYKIIYNLNRDLPKIIEVWNKPVIKEGNLICKDKENCLRLKIKTELSESDGLLAKYIRKYTDGESLKIITSRYNHVNHIVGRITEPVRRSECIGSGNNISANKRWENYINKVKEGKTSTFSKHVNKIYKELYKKDETNNLGVALEAHVKRQMRNNICMTFPVIGLGAVTSILESLPNPPVKWKILDPSAGWGDRMSNAAFLGADRVHYYLGLDPSTPMSTLYPKIMDTLQWLLKQVKDHPTGQKKKNEQWQEHPQLIDVLKIGSESVKYETQDQDSETFSTSDIVIDKEQGKITFQTKSSRPNLIFSSPPYFDAEQYSDEDTQSYRKFPTVREWKEGFLGVTLEKNIRLQEENGYLAINMADPSSVNIGNRSVEIVNYLIETVEKYPEMKYVGWIGLELGFVKDQKTVEPIFIWRKQNSTEQASSSTGQTIAHYTQEVLPLLSFQQNMKDGAVGTVEQRNIGTGTKGVRWKPSKGGALTINQYLQSLPPWLAGVQFKSASESFQTAEQHLLATRWKLSMDYYGEALQLLTSAQCLYSKDVSSRIPFISTAAQIGLAEADYRIRTLASQNVNLAYYADTYNHLKRIFTDQEKLPCQFGYTAERKANLLFQLAVVAMKLQLSDEACDYFRDAMAMTRNPNFTSSNISFFAEANQSVGPSLEKKRSADKVLEESTRASDKKRSMARLNGENGSKEPVQKKRRFVYIGEESPILYRDDTEGSVDSSAREGQRSEDGTATITYLQ